MPATLSIPAVAPGLDQRVDGDFEGPAIAQQRGDVTELDARLGVIRDGADRLAQKVELRFIHGGRV